MWFLPMGWRVNKIRRETEKYVLICDGIMLSFHVDEVAIYFGEVLRSATVCAM